MADIPGNNTTTTTVTVGSTTFNVLESNADHDWFKINLTSGQEITVALDALAPPGEEPDLDTYLIIRDDDGNILYEDDDIHTGVDTDSLLSFAADYTGVYYIDVGSWDDSSNGDYRLTVSAFQDPPVFTTDQIADQLVSGYWGDGSHPFDVNPGGTITVNLVGLTAAGQNLARTALQNWSQITGLSFSEVSGTAQITFSDESGPTLGGAWTESIYDEDGFTTSADVNVDVTWLTTYTSQVGGYAYQAYLHEIGHALGLGHAGNYNTVATYPYDALFQNDSWATSVMSYFSQEESDYFENLDFTKLFLATPMVADIVAMQELYGLSTTTRSGNTTYGYNSNAGNVYNANVSTGGITNVAVTIFDAGGTDTLDYSGSNAVQRIDLNPESFSNVLGQTGNLAIARGTIIENAIGGGGADVIIGNSAASTLSGGGGVDQLIGGAGDDTLSGNNFGDTLTGGVGNDTFRDTAVALNGDTITDFGAGDRIVITNASLSGFAFTVAGNTLTYSGGTLTLGKGVSGGTLVATAASGGGVQLAINVRDVASDFNGDGHSDILWRNDNGLATNWSGQGDGRFFDNYTSAIRFVPVDWQVDGVGDFNGDGKDDILWRHDDGLITNWLGQPDGGFTDNYLNAVRIVPLDWNVAGIGDFNGDGKDDVLWRHESGLITDWLGQANGTFSDNYLNAVRVFPNEWQIAGIGDFNGDGKDDILWRNEAGLLVDWLGQANGSFSDNYANSATNVPLDWHIEGVGDFNGDGKDDILWRNEAGLTTTWLGQANGSFTDNYANSTRNVSLDWHVEAIGDYNGDGRDDVLWRHDNGLVTDWLATAAGGFTDNYANVAVNVPVAWQVQDPGIHVL